MAGKAPKAGKQGGKGLIWLQGLACGACFAVAPTACLLLTVLLAPAIVALLFDRTQGRAIGRAVLLCAAAACVEPLVVFWRMGGQDAAMGFALLGEPATFGLAWAAGAAGWLLAHILPVGVRGVLEAASLSHAARLRAERERLVRAWGLEDQ